MSVFDSIQKDKNHIREYVLKQEWTQASKKNALELQDTEIILWQSVWGTNTRVTGAPTGATQL